MLVLSLSTFFFHYIIYWTLGIYLYFKYDTSLGISREDRYHTAAIVSINQLLIIPYVYVFGNAIVYTESQEFSWDKLLIYPISLILLLLCEEIGFYTTHRLFHTTWLYKYHKQHHEYYHPIGIAALYCSVPEFIISNLMPMIVSAIVVSRVYYMDVFLYYLWLFMATVNTVSEHSSLSLSPIRRHYRHHENNGKNFGVLGILDRVFGTLEVGGK